MRSWLVGPVLLALLVGAWSGSARAEVTGFDGTLRIEIGTLPPVVLTGTSVATVNSSGGGNHLLRLTLDGGISGFQAVAVTDPLVTAAGLISVRATATLGAGTLGFGTSSATATLNAPLTFRDGPPVKGFAALCLNTNCTAKLPLDLTQPTTGGGLIGVGLGGLLTINGFGQAFIISLEAAPWTVLTRTITGVPGDLMTTTGPGTMQTTMSFTAMGFRHGPVSQTTSTALKSGVVQLISPLVVTTKGIPANNEKLAVFGILTLHFIPEPGLMLLLGSGVVGLILLGRHRLHR